MGVDEAGTYDPIVNFKFFVSMIFFFFDLKDLSFLISYNYALPDWLLIYRKNNIG